MEKSVEKKFIEGHRQDGRPIGADQNVPQRRKRAYRYIGISFVGFALIDLIDSALNARLTPYRITFVAIILFVGVINWCLSYRYPR